ncbi:MAG: DEAD/DEAH box helicase, partial [Ilumatobacteraceae bacterium]
LVKDGRIRSAEVLAALWDLVWSGEVTNDSLAPLRSYLAGGGRPSRPARARPRPGRLTRIGPPAGAGRWSLVSSLVEPARSSATATAHAVALALLERHGVVTREAVAAEGVVGGYATLYRVLTLLEERGRCRRGYFVAGLGAAQFALPGAVDRLRAALPTADARQPAVLAATDPAQPFGAALEWPATAGRPARSANAVVVLADGEPLVWFDHGSHHVVTFEGARRDGRWAEALAALVKDGRIRSAEVRKLDGEVVERSGAWADALRAAGFEEGYRGWVRRS